MSVAIYGQDDFGTEDNRIDLENTWVKEKGATPDDIEGLVNWMRRNHFPSQYLPMEYIQFLRESNGGVFTNGKREYQFLAAEEVAEMYEAYKFYLYMPYAFPFALDGNGDFYLFDLRRQNESVFAVHTGNMGWGLDECYLIAENFGACLQQREPLEEMMKIPYPGEKEFMVHNTPLGDLEVLVDNVSVPFIVREIPDRRWPQLDGRIMIMLLYEPDGRTHRLSCVLKGHVPHPNDGLESGERLSSIGLYTEDGKISIGIEYDGWWTDGKYYSDYDYQISYDENGRLSFEVTEETKTNKYIWGIAWVEHDIEGMLTNTWLGADPTLY